MEEKIKENGNGTPLLDGKKEVLKVFVNYRIGEIGFCNLGYHDFGFVKESRATRVQNYHTLHYIVKGKGRLTAFGKEYELKAGQFFYLPPDVEFCYYPQKADPWTYFWFAVSGECANVFSRAGFANGRTVETCTDNEKARNILECVLQKAENDELTEFSVASAFFALLECVATENRNEPCGDFVVDLARQIIALAHVYPDFTVESLAAALHVSHSYLCKKFSEAGTTPKDELLKARFSTACDLLKSGTSVQDSAMLAGFNDYVHFLKFFKQRYGVSPGKFGREARNSKNFVNKSVETEDIV